MLGIIVTGHGNFASGLQSSLKLIAGEKEYMYFVDFEENDSVEDLQDKLNNAIIDLDDCSGILVLSDLTGGSPFKTSVELSVTSSKDITVVGGTNLPMIIELSMAKDFVEDLEALTDMAINTGKENIVRYTYVTHSEENTDEDGI